MNTSLANQSTSGLQTSRRRVQAQVVTLERVQQTCSTAFHPTKVAKQQHPRFYSNDNGLLPLYLLQTEVEGMRGVLESCWDLSAPGTATTPVPAFSPRHVQQQRLKRSLGDHLITHAAPVAHTPAQQQEQQQQRRRPRRKGRGRSSAQSAAAPAPSPVPQPLLQEISSSSSSSRGPAQDQQTHYLQVIMDLWHLHTTHDGFKAATDAGHTIRLPEAPRLLTAEEERVLGCIIQQHRKLQQLLQEHPDVAAAAFGSGSPTSSSSSSSEGGGSDGASAADSGVDFGGSSGSGGGSSSSGGGDSSSSSSSGPAKRDKRYKWPPALTPADVAEVTQLPSAWRSLLPLLAAQATELLVAFNVGLVLYMLRQARRARDVPEGDLVTSGIAGLRLAANRFDPAKGTRFSTVATAWIAQHISRSSFAEAGKAMRRPAHHVAMVHFVANKHGLQAVADIEQRPDIQAQVAAHFKTRPSAVVEAVRDTYRQQSPLSLQGNAIDARSSKGDAVGTSWSNLLSTADLDEDDGDLQSLGTPGQGLGSISGGLGTLMASAGQIPGWAQAGIRGLQQQQQLVGEAVTPAGSAAAVAAGAGGVGADSVSSAQQRVAAAAARLLQLGPAADAAAASPSSSAAAAAVSTTGSSMLDSLDDSHAVLQASMQEVLQVLSPTEARVISTLYGLEGQGPAGLGVELPYVDYGGVSSSSSGSSSSGRGRGGATTQQKPAGKKDYSKTLPTARHQRGVLTLAEAAVELGLPSHQMVAGIRNNAFRKLAAVARAAAAAAASDGDRRRAAAATPSSSSSSSSSRDEGRVAAAAGDINVRGSTLRVVDLLRQYVQQYGHLPDDPNQPYKGRYLYSWLSCLRRRYWRGRVAPVVVATLEQTVPLWHWGSPPQPDTAATAAAVRVRPSRVLTKAGRGSPAAVGSSSSSSSPPAAEPVAGAQQQRGRRASPAAATAAAAVGQGLAPAVGADRIRQLSGKQLRRQRRATRSQLRPQQQQQP